MKNLKSVVLMSALTMNLVNAEYLMKSNTGVTSGDFSTSEEQASGLVTDSLIIQLDASNTASIDGGTTWTDISGNGNNFTLFNGAYKTSNYVHFDGVNDYATKSNNPSTLNYDRSSFTVEAWYRRHSSTNDTYDRGVFTKWESGAGGPNEFILNDNVNTVYFNADVDDGSTPNNGGQSRPEYNTNINMNEWRQLVATFNDGVATLYLNGVQVAQDTSPTTSVDTSSEYLMIASFNNGNRYYTAIDVSKILMYNKALSDSEVTQNFNTYKDEFGL